MCSFEFTRWHEQSRELEELYFFIENSPLYNLLFVDFCLLRFPTYYGLGTLRRFQVETLPLNFTFFNNTLHYLFISSLANQHLTKHFLRFLCLKETPKKKWHLFIRQIIPSITVTILILFCRCVLSATIYVHISNQFH